MKESVRGIMRYPLSLNGKKYNTVLTLLDAKAIADGNTGGIYRLPGVELTPGQKKEMILVDSIRAELALEVNKITYYGSIFTKEGGDTHLYFIKEATGNIQQPFFRGDRHEEGYDPKVIRGIGFLNNSLPNQIPVERLQEHVRYLVQNLLGKQEYGLETYWGEGNPRYTLPRYFVSGNMSDAFYDWEQQCRINKRGKPFSAVYRHS